MENTENQNNLNRIIIESNNGDILAITTHNNTDSSRQQAIYNLINDDDLLEDGNIDISKVSIAEMEFEGATDQIKEIVEKNLVMFSPETFICFRPYKLDENQKLIPIVIDVIKSENENIINNKEESGV